MIKMFTLREVTDFSVYIYGCGQILLTAKTVIQQAKPCCNRLNLNKHSLRYMYVSVKLFYRPVVLYFAFLSSIWFQTLNYVLFVSFVGGIEFFFTNTTATEIGLHPLMILMSVFVIDSITT